MWKIEQGIWLFVSCWSKKKKLLSYIASQLQFSFLPLFVCLLWCLKGPHSCLVHHLTLIREWSLWHLTNCSCYSARSYLCWNCSTLSTLILGDFFWSGQMALWLNYLLCNHEDLNSDPQHLHASQLRWWIPVTIVIGDRGRKMLGACLPANIVKADSSSFSERNKKPSAKCEIHSCGIFDHTV